MYGVSDLQKLVEMLAYLGIGGFPIPAHSVVIGGGSVSPGGPGTLFASNGISSDPSFQSLSALGIQKVVGSVAAISALDVSQASQAFATGYFAAGDGGGGAYYYSAGSSATVNNGTVLSASGGVGRWLLIYGSEVSVLQFGAKADNGVTDNGAPFNACAQWCWQNNVPMRIPASRGVSQVYGFNTPFTDSAWGAGGSLIPAMIINSDHSATLRAYSSMSRLVDLTSTYKFGCKIRLGRIDGNSLATTAIQISNIQDSEVWIGSAANTTGALATGLNISVPNSNPSHITVFNNKFHIDLLNNNAYGLVVQSPTTGVYGVQGNIFSWGQIIGNTQNGITIGQPAAGDVTQYNVFDGGVVEGNTVNGIIDYSGNNRIEFSNTNSNGSNGIVVAATAKPDIVIGVVSDTYLDQTGASKSIITGP